MTSPPPTKSILEQTKDFATTNLNFYRVHLLSFTFAPLFFSGIFYASNGEHHINYIDSLFNCVSAMTVCGLATVNLSSLTAWQQVILFIQMCLGSPVVVSWVVVLIRKYYFVGKFQHTIQALQKKGLEKDPEQFGTSSATPWIPPFLRSRKGLSVVKEESHDKEPSSRGGSITKRLRPDMIKRMDDAPKLINPSGGWVEEEVTPPVGINTNVEAKQDEAPRLSFLASSPTRGRQQGRSFRRTITEDRQPVKRGRPRRRLSDPGVASRPSSPATPPMQRYDTVAEDLVLRPSGPGFPRTQTVEWAPSVARRRNRPAQSPLATHHETITSIDPWIAEDYRSVRRPSLARPHSISTHVTTQTWMPRNAKDEDFGGFPMPLEILTRLFGRLFPKAKRTLTRTLTIPATTSLVSQGGAAAVPPNAKPVPYISFDATVGRNSAFRWLTSEQLEELGGVEYRALNALLWIVGGYHIITQLVSFIVIAPYMSIRRWESIFQPPQQIRPVNSTWFSLYQVVSSYTNTGTSLVDQSMVPFQAAYPTILFMMFLILAGNTCFPIFLRFTIWVLSKIVPKTSRLHETLHFLLDHPRRCFIYLFPAHQTWFLFTIVIMLTTTDWFFFMILDIGNPVIEAIPLGLRFLLGLLQGIAVRAAGFGAVPLAALAPSVKILYLVMMYISVYPMAMSVRSTNVYEEQSLGIYPPPEDQNEDFHTEEGSTPHRVWSSYLAMHARKQLAFDMWWLALALFLVCIIERHMLVEESNYGWFNIFNITFELVSAYGTVGLSLGLPDQNYSLSGAFRPLSKLIVCFVMLRGRHRGLPVAIDRAVLLPNEFGKDYLEEGRSRQEFDDLHRRGSYVSHHQSFSGHPTPLDEKRQELPIHSNGNGYATDDQSNQSSSST